MQLLERALAVEPNRTGDDLEFRRLLEKLPAAAYTCDADGLITYFNEYAARLWGRHPKLNDPVDRFCGSFRIFSPDGRPLRLDRCWMALALEEDREYNGHEIIIERPDGSRRIATAHANPLHDERGRLTGAVNVLMDITERKQIEEALKDADRRKDEFLALLAHELRNPLAPIRSGLEAMTVAKDDPVMMEEIRRTMQRQTLQLIRLVDDLLDVSRITQGKLELRKCRVLLSETIQSAVEASKPLLDEAGHQLTVAVPEPAIYINADPHRLSQVLSNLLNNAAKFTPEGGHIRLSAERQGSEVLITVKDNGIGIPADMIERIFEMFAQVDRSIRKDHAGLGIGLTLVKSLVEMHGGRIEVHSAGRNQGSEFWVRLPMLVDVPAVRTPPSAAETVGKVTKLRILLVDDNKAAANMLGLIVNMLGHEVRKAGDGQEAIEVAAEFRPDVVLMDLGMPKMNGFETARYIRAQDWGQDVALVALTGWGQGEDRQRTKDAGFDRHLVKPVEPEAFERLCAELGQKRCQQQYCDGRAKLPGRF